MGNCDRHPRDAGYFFPGDLFNRSWARGLRIFRRFLSGPFATHEARGDRYGNYRGLGTYAISGLRCDYRGQRVKPARRTLCRANLLCPPGGRMALFLAVKVTVGASTQPRAANRVFVQSPAFLCRTGLLCKAPARGRGEKIRTQTPCAVVATLVFFPPSPLAGEGLGVREAYSWYPRIAHADLVQKVRVGWLGSSRQARPQGSGRRHEFCPVHPSGAGGLG